MINPDNRIVKLLIMIDKIEEDYYCCDDYLIEELDSLLTSLYVDNSYLQEDIEKISLIETDVFTNNEYFTIDYRNNPIRKEIANYIDKNNSKQKLYIDYQLILNNLSDDYKLVNYLEPDIFKDKDKVIELVVTNSEVINLMDESIFDVEMMTKILKRADSTIFLMLDGNNIFGYQDTWIYKNRNKYLDNKKIYELYILGLIKYIEEDVNNYSKLSLESRNILELAKKALSIDSRYICYAGSDICSNKELMIEILKINKDNYYYLSDELKNDKDIIDIMNS